MQYVDVWLWRCEVPSRLDEAIVNKLVTEQKKRTMRHRQAATLIASTSNPNRNRNPNLNPSKAATLIGEQTESLVARTGVSAARLLHAARAEAVLEVTLTRNPKP